VDCNLALQLDNKYIKAILRRATIHHKLLNFTDAYLGIFGQLFFKTQIVISFRLFESTRI
jgi:hypothetical protein